MTQCRYRHCIAIGIAIDGIKIYKGRGRSDAGAMHSAHGVTWRDTVVPRPARADGAGHCQVLAACND